MIGKGRVVGVDLGTRRIGIAVTDSEQRIATGISTVERTGDRSASHRAIASLVDEYEAVGVVVGLPVSMSGDIGPAARSMLEEIEVLRHTLGVELETVDERLSTASAAGALRAGGRSARTQRGVIDRTAAAVLLQSWADRRRSVGVAGD